jgi:hypothetical protein
MASAESLNRADCRPITAENAKACCAAANWKTLILPQDEDFCLARRQNEPLASLTPDVNTLEPGTPPAGITNPPGDTNNPPGDTNNPPDDTNNPPDTADNGINNGFGNGDQVAPGNSELTNNAENDVDGRDYPGGSAH